MQHVTVLLRTLNPGADLGRILDALAEQTRAPEEILAVDSGSTDGSRELLARAGARIVPIAAGEFTHARSTNLGFREARGGVVAMLSQDAIPASPRWLERLLEPLADPGVGAVFGRQLPRPGCFPLERWELERCYPEQGSPAVVYSNVNSAARRERWEEEGYDESLLIAEDGAWARALAARGHRVAYAPRAEVIHSHEYTLSQVFARCRAEAETRLAAEGRREGVSLLFKAWPRQTWRDLLRLRAEGRGGTWPRAAAYRFAQFAGMVRGGRG